MEEQLAEFDTEREQLRSRLKKEEAQCCQLQQQVGALTRWSYEAEFEFHIQLSVFSVCVRAGRGAEEEAE